MANDHHKHDKDKDKALKAAGVEVIKAGDPTEPPENPADAVVIHAQGSKSIPGMADPDFDPSGGAPSIPAYPVPTAAGGPADPNVTKDVSGDARGAKSVGVTGWVDHDIMGSDGKLFAGHTPGPIQIPNAVAADGSGATPNPPQVPDAVKATGDAKPAK